MKRIEVTVKESSIADAGKGVWLLPNQKITPGEIIGQYSGFHYIRANNSKLESDDTVFDVKVGLSYVSVHVIDFLFESAKKVENICFQSLLKELGVKVCTVHPTCSLRMLILFSHRHFKTTCILCKRWKDFAS
jgi:ribosomal protein L27